jgi:hypothetical protein
MTLSLFARRFAVRRDARTIQALWELYQSLEARRG